MSLSDFQNCEFVTVTPAAQAFPQNSQLVVKLDLVITCYFMRVLQKVLRKMELKDIYFGTQKKWKSIPGFFTICIFLELFDDFLCHLSEPQFLLNL